MRTLEEAIAHARDVASEQRRSGTCTTNDNECDKFSNCMKCAEEHEQLAEWLEELKAYQQHEIICNKGYNAGYKKAIDDFERIMCEELKDYIDHKDYMCVGLSFHKFTRDLAEQLKAGGENV